MKAVILAGGLGTQISEEKNIKPESITSCHAVPYVILILL